MRQNLEMASALRRRINPCSPGFSPCSQFTHFHSQKNSVSLSGEREAPEL